MVAISLKDVWLKYRVEFKEGGRFIPEDFPALKGINIEVNKGDVFGIIGENGAGKTTILKIIAGMVKPDQGIVDVKGTVSAIMEIGAGFHKELTGSENIYLISSLFGLKQEQIEQRYLDIVKFAAIGRFINARVKTYSQGMYMRLAFAIAIHMSPDILLVDDVFAVGDTYAQLKCTNMMFELKEHGKTIIFVSHDIEMAKRLCTKGIFLREGQIIKTGAIEKVCSYYLESVGDKKGIAILQKGFLGLIFNNGKLILRWQDNAITSHSAGQVRMLLGERKYLSTTATWQVQGSKNKNEIIVMGSWPDIPVTQTWRIIFLNENELLLEITLNMEGEVVVGKIETEVMFLDSYTHWFTLKDESSFPKGFVHEKEWEYITIEDPGSKIIGLRPAEESGLLPIIVFDRLRDDIEMKSHVGNTGLEFGCRVVQYQVSAKAIGASLGQNQYRCFSGKIRIFESVKNGDLKLYLDQARQAIKESTIISNGAISVFCRHNSIELYWQNRLVTQGTGLSTKFSCDGVNYSSQHGRWSIDKKMEEEISIIVSWGDPRFFQVWSIKLNADNTLTWIVEFDIREKVSIRNSQAEFIANSDYNGWFTEEEKGDFKRLANPDGSIVLSKYINDYMGLYNSYNADNSALPRVLFSHNGKLPLATYISRFTEDLPVIKLRYLGIDLEEDAIKSAGIYRYFEGRISLSRDDEQGQTLVTAADRNFNITGGPKKAFERIGFGKLSLILDYGKGRIFWDKEELTCGLGLYSSVSSEGVWFDSSQASWRTHILEQRRLVAVGSWPWIPMTQEWEISLLNEKTIKWKITKQAWGKVTLDCEQANLMLSNKYREWFTGKYTNGNFPEKFKVDCWDRLWCGDMTSSAGVRKCKLKKNILNRKFLPTVVFGCSTDSHVRHCVIENTDNLFQGRILQYELYSQSTNDLLEKRYFEGQIKII